MRWLTFTTKEFLTIRIKVKCIYAYKELVTDELDGLVEVYFNSGNFAESIIVRGHISDLLEASARS